MALMKVSWTLESNIIHVYYRVLNFKGLWLVYRRLKFLKFIYILNLFIPTTCENLLERGTVKNQNNSIIMYKCRKTKISQNIALIFCMLYKIKWCCEACVKVLKLYEN